MEPVTGFPFSCGYDVTWCDFLAALGLGDDGLECDFLGLARLGEHCLDLTSSFGIRFKLKESGLPGAGLRGIRRLSPGAPRVRKTSGNVQGCSKVLCPYTWRGSKRRVSTHNDHIVVKYFHLLTVYQLWCEAHGHLHCHLGKDMLLLDMPERLFSSSTHSCLSAADHNVSRSKWGYLSLGV